MPDDRETPVHDEQERLPQDDFEQELYTALRAAGASPEEAQSCLHAAPKISL